MINFQVCTMEFEIQGVSDNLLILKKEEDGVIYEGILPDHVNLMLM